MKKTVEATVTKLSHVQTGRAAPDAAGMGVLTVLNNEIHCARDVYKSNTLRVETFKPNELGFLGYADSDHQVVFYRRPFRKHTTDTPFTVDGRNDLPRVDIVYAYAGADGMLIDAVRAHGSAGLVLAGFGAGTFPPAVINAAEQAVADGMPGARQPLQRRPRRDDTAQSGAGLHRVRQPDAAESPPFADAGPDGNHQPQRTAANVLRILTVVSPYCKGRRRRTMDSPGVVWVRG
jgi:hypothetical protein